MTSAQPADDRKSAIMKKSKNINEKIAIDPNGSSLVGDETRSFLDFSRENLSISHSELEQGFNRHSRCYRLSGHTMLSIAAIVVALGCAGIEIWKVHRVLSNSREIEILKRDFDNLRHRLFGEDSMDELDAFEQQFYADGADTDEDSGETDIEGADYDSNYDEDYASSWANYAGDSRESTDSSVVQDSPSTSSSTVDRDRRLVEMLAVLRKVEAKRAGGGDQDFKKKIPEIGKNIAKDRKDEETKNDEPRNLDTDPEITKDHRPKSKRAATEETPIYHDNRNRTRQEILANAIERSKISTTEIAPWDRHPPKKYFSPSRAEYPMPRREPGERRPGSFRQRKNFRSIHRNDVSRRSLEARGMSKRHLRSPRQIFAAHYGADSSLFGMDDEHTGNGRAKHNEGIFKAWRPSDWVTDLGMTRHFTLSRDGRLTVHEAGLYIVYGQIHYLDEHDENGFHLLVNGQPILQCMVYSPGTGHKSRSCFSAQVTVLRSGDRLVLKDVGPARYTLFQRDKSFFGLVKLGDSRPQQQSSPRHTTQPSEIER